MLRKKFSVSADIIVVFRRREAIVYNLVVCSTDIVLKTQKIGIR